MAQPIVMHLTLDHVSQVAVAKLRGLSEFAKELAEDFSCREDVRQAHDDIRWLLQHITLESSEDRSPAQK